MKTNLVHNNSEHLSKSVDRRGWSWGAFFLSFIWYAIHGMWGKALLYLLLILITSFTIIVPIIIWFVMAMRFKSEYYEYLIKQGYSENRI